MNDTLYDSKNYPDFASQNNGSGLLKVQVFTANQAFPLKDVDITIYKDIDGKRHTYDANGNEVSELDVFHEYFAGMD